MTLALAHPVLLGALFSTAFAQPQEEVAGTALTNAAPNFLAVDSAIQDQSNTPPQPPPQADDADHAGGSWGIGGRVSATAAMGLSDLLADEKTQQGPLDWPEVSQMGEK